MTAYQPESRRPIAGIFRRTADGTVRWCVRHAIHPDAVSYGSIIASAAAAACFWQSGAWPALLIAAVAFCYLRLWLNMLDGMVALAAGKASPHGEVLNDLPDRLSDILIFTGVAHSGLCHPLTAYWAAILALMTAYIGTLGQAVGARRQFGGVMAKPWRMVALHVGAWITLGVLWWGKSPMAGGGLTILDCTNIVIIAGCLQTIWVRLARIMRVLHTGGRSTAGMDSPSGR